MHPWASRATSPNKPNSTTIALDPSDNHVEKLISTGFVPKKLFEKMKLRSFVKTLGKSGMHLLLPYTGIEYGQASTIAEKFCKQIQELVPRITTTSVSVISQEDKLYVDPSQNDYGDRIARERLIRQQSQPHSYRKELKGTECSYVTMKSIIHECKKHAICGQIF